ncbi:MAG TPA: SRPBCC domain-containing protein [Chitinophagaceae bacterium]|nr:SRPBCC domain-containing protein [Chitinophagaceae bacterium]
MAINISTIFIETPVQKVWDALTKPGLVKQWQYGSDLITDWKIGNDIRFRTEWEGKIFEQWGKVLEVRPNDLLMYNLFAPRPGLEDKPENYFIMSYILTQEIGQTKLQIIQEDNRPNAIQEEPQGEENPIPQSLKKVIETN